VLAMISRYPCDIPKKTTARNSNNIDMILWVCYLIRIKPYFSIYSPN
jgi:hypothetical protein